MENFVSDSSVFGQNGNISNSEQLKKRRIMNKNVCSDDENSDGNEIRNERVINRNPFSTSISETFVNEKHCTSNGIMSISEEPVVNGFDYNFADEEEIHTIEEEKDSEIDDDMQIISGIITTHKQVKFRAPLIENPEKFARTTKKRKNSNRKIKRKKSKKRKVNQQRTIVSMFAAASKTENRNK